MADWYRFVRNCNGHHKAISFIINNNKMVVGDVALQRRNPLLCGIVHVAALTADRSCGDSLSAHGQPGINIVSRRSIYGSDSGALRAAIGRDRADNPQNLLRREIGGHHDLDRRPECRRFCRVLVTAHLTTPRPVGTRKSRDPALRSALVDRSEDQVTVAMHCRRV